MLAFVSRVLDVSNGALSAPLIRFRRLEQVTVCRICDHSGVFVHAIVTGSMMGSDDRILWHDQLGLSAHDS